MKAAMMLILRNRKNLTHLRKKLRISLRRILDPVPEFGRKFFGPTEIEMFLTKFPTKKLQKVRNYRSKISKDSLLRPLSTTTTLPMTKPVKIESLKSALERL